MLWIRCTDNDAFVANSFMEMRVPTLDKIIMVVIHVESTGLNLARISQRVLDGGHNVPTDKVEARIPRMLDNVRLAIPLCDQVRVLDNSRLDNPFQPVLTIKQGVRTEHLARLPEWAAGL